MANKVMSRYAEAGVDIDKGNAFIDAIKPIVASTFRPGVLTGIGGFGGLFALGGGKFQDPVLVSSTDGGGTKLKTKQVWDLLSDQGHKVARPSRHRHPVAGRSGSFPGPGLGGDHH